ncbi:DUF1697 domain-containing protein [Flocculibacter collagenilyticus]|uniref:DUF1697 domain-containing protein n=1 Tax=Flocculibacter collagenilyticus TaxID=2744479 RepID=UPI0018F2BFCE|nr:DUF1697 domain-containing protein [Flocculibacter collagenilyticus]
MGTYILLLRAINVGGKNLLPMKELVPLLETLGYHHIQTYIQTGNVVFQSEQLPCTDTIQKSIEQQFSFKPSLMILTLDAFNEALANNPFKQREGKLVHYYFCQPQPSLDLDKINQLKTPTELYAYHNHVFYLYAPDGIGRSKLVANIEKCLGVDATGRNLNTVNKLQTMLLNKSMKSE